MNAISKLNEILYRAAIDKAWLNIYKGIQENFYEYIKSMDSFNRNYNQTTPTKEG